MYCEAESNSSHCDHYPSPDRDATRTFSERPSSSLPDAVRVRNDERLLDFAKVIAAGGQDYKTIEIRPLEKSFKIS
ncbi:MAG: hypothetical protein V7K38_13585 [Nostoc sp.]|uniref:hypothetical protein n=1 Tax=Nostoc sp. TaxID=1180 RepID=UPI002FF99C21